MTTVPILEDHPIAAIFPLLEGVALAEMATSIRANGLRVPIRLYEGKILDGRNRYRACVAAGVTPTTSSFKGDAAEAIALVWDSNRIRRHLNPSQAAVADAKREKALKVYGPVREAAKERQREGGREKVRQQIAEAPDARKTDSHRAKAAGTNRSYVALADKLVEERPELAEEVASGKLTLSRAKRQLQKEQEQQDLEEARAQVDEGRLRALKSVCDLRVCSCRDLFDSEIKPDAVITDPPYPKEYLHVFTELAESCAIAGVPVVAVMSGQSYLPEVMRRLCEHLTYRWTLAYLTPGGQAVQQWQAKVNTTWKPVLLFGEADEWFGDVAASRVNDNDKRFHKWGQSESGMADLVERLTKPGQLVCDPFLGGGTTAVVSLVLGRHFVGCDIDAACIEQARQRVETMPCSP